MAETTIYALTQNSALAGTDEIALQESGGGNTLKTTFNRLPYRGGALVKLSTDEVITTATVTQIPWDAAEYDTDSFWAGGSPSRLTVPTNVTKVRVYGAVTWESQANNEGERRISLLKNGAQTTHGLPSRQHVLDSPDYDSRDVHMSFSSPVIQVSGSDYFELSVYHGFGSDLDVMADSGARTYFGIEIIERTD